jgi:Spy/CpxP family protein refolding chaperone
MTRAGAQQEKTMKHALITASIAALFFALPAWAQQAEHEKHHPGGAPALAAPVPGGGMMGPAMMGPGMMGGGMMGRGMMGPGMMGQGMGPGAMLDSLDLTEEQQAKLQKIHDELRDRHWESMGQMMKEGSRMRELFAAPKMDRPALEAAHRRMSALREQMFMAQLDTHAQIEASLTSEQRARLRQRMRRGGMMMH